MAGTPTSSSPYRRRIVDDELDDLLGDLPAISLDGAKGVGKTSTARARGGTFLALDDPRTLALLEAGPEVWERQRGLVVVDEWQRYPASWDYVRRAVDAQVSDRRFLLTGSATPKETQTHSGAGRIVRMRMRPMTLDERGVTTPTVSLAALLDGSAGPVEGATDLTLVDYTEEIVRGGLPGLRRGSPRAQALTRDGYVELIVDRDFAEAGATVRNPVALRRWLSAYAAATATTATFESIRDAATAGQHDKPSKPTSATYRDTLERIWISDPVPGWASTLNHLRRLTLPPKHHLADPALACALLGLGGQALLAGEGPSVAVRGGTFLGALFESLVTLGVRVYAQAADARVFHLRTKGETREIDLIVERRDRRVLALEVKLSATVRDEDVRHLTWLRDQIGPALVDAVIVTTGRDAYRRQDGVAVVPLALLGP